MPQTKFPKLEVQGVEEIVDAIIDLIKKNLIARTPITQNIAFGDKEVYVTNTMQYRAGEEIIFINNYYNDSNSNKYQVYERARIKSIVDTHKLILISGIVSTDGWTTADGTSMQKCIGHSPLFAEHVFYGDREVIPINDVAITVEPTSLSNDWMYLQGGLNEEYTFEITIYAKEIKTEDGVRILHKYADAMKQLLNDNIHLRVNCHETPLFSNASIGSDTVIISDTQENREIFSPYTPTLYNYEYAFEVQDNKGVSKWLKPISASAGGGLIRLKFSETLSDNFRLENFAVVRRIGRYIWDSRARGVTYGKIQKGGAFLRAASIDWFGKSVIEHRFPQVSNRTEIFDEIVDNDSSSSSSLDSSSSSSIDSSSSSSS